MGTRPTLEAEPPGCRSRHIDRNVLPQRQLSFDVQVQKDKGVCARALVDPTKCHRCGPIGEAQRSGKKSVGADFHVETLFPLSAALLAFGHRNEAGDKHRHSQGNPVLQL